MRKDERLTYISESGERVEISTRSYYTPFWLEDVEGIDGLDNTVNTAKGSGQAGETFISMTPDKRRITISGKIMRDQAENRRVLIRAFNVLYSGRLVYERGALALNIECKIKKAPKFSNTAFEEFDVVLECPYPYFKLGDGTTENRVEIASWIGGIAFEFAIPDAGIGFEERAQSLITNIYNEGEAEAGMKIKFKATGTASNPSLTHIGLQKKIELDVDMQTGDIVTVSTGYGKKRATLMRAGVETNIFNKITADSNWLQLMPGDNLLRYNATPIENIEVVVTFDTLYGGV